MEGKKKKKKSIERVQRITSCFVSERREHAPNYFPARSREFSPDCLSWNPLTDL